MEDASVGLDRFCPASSAALSILGLQRMLVSAAIVQCDNQDVESDTQGMVRCIGNVGLRPGSTRRMGQWYADAPSLAEALGHP